MPGSIEKNTALTKEELGALPQTSFSTIFKKKYASKIGNRCHRISFIWREALFIVHPRFMQWRDHYL